MKIKRMALRATVQVKMGEDGNPFLPI